MGDDTDQDDVLLSPVNRLSPERARRKQRLMSLATGLGAIFLAFLFVGDRMVGRRSTVEDVYNRGVDLRRQGKLDEAIAEYRAAIKLRPSFAEAHNNLGEALRLQGKYEEAIAAFRAAIRVKADHANAHYNLAISLVAQERLDEAVSEFREAIRTKPDHGRAYIGLSALLEARGKPEEALAVYREAARKKPDDAYVQNALAKALVRSANRPPPDYSEALEHARAAVAIAPKIGFAYDTVALAEYRLGHWTQSVAAAENAVTLREGGDAALWFILAMARWQTGDKAEARASFAKAASLAKQPAAEAEDVRPLWAEAAELLGEPGPRADP